MCLGQPSFQDACDNGLKWCVLAADTTLAWPQLPDLVQKALNTHSRQDQSEVEVMLDMKNMWDQAIKCDTEVDWKQVMNSACSQSPPCKSYIDHLANYLQKQAPELMVELSTFAKTCDPGKKTQVAIRPHGGSEFWQKLNSLSWGKVERFPHVLHAAVCANLASPPNKIIDGCCRLITPSSLVALSNKANLAKVREAEAFLTMIRKVVKSLELDEMAAATSIGRATCRIMYKLLNKGKDSMEGITYKSIEEIAEACFC